MAEKNRIRLKAGDLTMDFEPQQAFLRYVKFGGTEILRGVYAAVRDHNWDTIEPRVKDIDLQQSEDGFELRFNVACTDGELDFAWHGIIAGGNGRVTFSMEGTALSDFRRNRIGFCVLHPAACAGLPCKVEHTDASLERGDFPHYISPHQPFMDMKNISHEMDGVRVNVSFAGDVFEMEDQRNWTDASFKTYCTPLGLPFPVDVSLGDVIRQSIVIEAESDERPVAGGDELSLEVQSGRGVDLMQIGLGCSSDGAALTATELERLRALYLSHLRVDLHLERPHWPDTLERAGREAEDLEAGLEIAVFVNDEADTQLQELSGCLADRQICRILVFHEKEKATSSKWVLLAKRRLGHLSAPIGSGTDIYFTELNRERPSAEDLDLVCYSVNPQVHAFDDASLVETLSAQALTVESARQFCADTPLAVSPITLRPRFNPNATGPEPEPEDGALPSQVDVRQMSLFGAGWTAISMKYLGLSGLLSATYFETTGWRGVMERASGSPLPAAFPSLAGAVFPLYHVLADVGEFVGGQVLPVATSDALRVDGLALSRNGRRRLLLVNLTDETISVRVYGWEAPARVRQLDEQSVEEAMRSPEAFRQVRGVLVDALGVVKLGPYALACVDEEHGK